MIYQYIDFLRLNPAEIEKLSDEDINQPSAHSNIGQSLAYHLVTTFTGLMLIRANPKLALKIELSSLHSLFMKKIDSILRKEIAIFWYAIHKVVRF